MRRPFLNRVSSGPHFAPGCPLAESLAKQVRDVLDQIESILAAGTDFDPARAQRTFSIIASDVLSVILLKPLRAWLAIEAPSVRVRVSPPARLRLWISACRPRGTVRGTVLWIVPAQ